jgi:hypothetical protein
LEVRAFLDEPAPHVTPRLSIGFVGPEQAGLLSIYERRQGGFLATLSRLGPFLLDPMVVEKLERSLESRTPASFNLDEATRVVLEATGPDGTRTLELVRRGGELIPMFRQEAPPSSDIPALLETVSPLWALPDTPRPRSGAAAMLSLRIESEGKSEPFHLTFYKVPGIFVRGEGGLVAFGDHSKGGFAFDERAVKRLLDSF